MVQRGKNRIVHRSKTLESAETTYKIMNHVEVHFLSNFQRFKMHLEKILDSNWPNTAMQHIKMRIDVWGLRSAGQCEQR